MDSYENYLARRSETTFLAVNISTDSFCASFFSILYIFFAFIYNAKKKAYTIHKRQENDINLQCVDIYLHTISQVEETLFAQVFIILIANLPHAIMSRSTIYGLP